MGFLDSTGITTLVTTLKDKFALKSDLNTKQDTLVSGTNLKTVNNNSLLGSGNVAFPSELPSRNILTSISLIAADTGYAYRLWLTSSDGTKYVPINTSNSMSTTTEKTLNTRPINPFGLIIYSTSSSSVSSGNAMYTNYTNLQYQSITIGYSYKITLTNRTPVYLKCTPQADGSAVMNEVTQTLPTTNDGYIYIFLGTATSSSNFSLHLEHPVYYYADGAIREWTNNKTPTATEVGAVPLTTSTPSNMNDLVTTGIYYYSSSTTNHPGSTNGTVIVFRTSDTYVYQMAFPNNSSGNISIYVRMKYGSTNWSSWTNILA